jgi:ABC-type transporter Mla subunit MlaD
MADDIIIRVRVRDQTVEGIRDAQGRLRDLRGRFLAEGDAAGRGFSRGANRGLRDVQQGLSAAAGAMARIGGSAGGILFAAGAMQQLAGAALVLPGAFSAAAAVVATFKIALSGIGEALGATSGGASGAGANMAAFGRQVRDANRAIEDANRGVENANRALADAYRGVEDAERQVVGAKRGVVRATEDYQRALADERDALARIDDARRDAIRTLADLAEAQDDSVRSVEGAEIALKRAQEGVLRANKDVKATALDRQEAAFRVKEAEDRLSDAQREATDATDKYSQAQAKGVEGSDQVRAAQDAAAAAHDRTVAAAEGVVAANESLDDAYRGVEDAQRGVEDAQRGVEDAHRAVADAIENLDDVYAQQREQMAAAAGGVDAYAEALSKISPEAREVVKVLRELGDEWQAVQFAVQDAFFEGTAEDISALAETYLPLLRDGLSGIAGELNDMGDFAFDALMDPDVVESVNKVLDNTAFFLGNAETALGDFIAGFLQLAGIGSDFLPGLGTWIADIAREFRGWVETDPEAVRQFIIDGLAGFDSLWQIISNVVDIVGSLLEGLSGGEDAGGGFLDMVGDMTQSLLDFVESEGVQTFLAIIGEIARMIIETIPIWGPVAAGMALVAGAMWLVNIAMSANPIGLIIILITTLVATFVYLWNNVEGFRNFWIGVWEFIAGAFTGTIDFIGQRFSDLWGVIQTIAGWIAEKVGSMFDGLAGGAKWAVNAAITPLNGLITGINWIIDGLNAVNPFAPIPHIPYVSYLARGGVASGFAMVGENGPELVDLPTGSRVHPAGDTARMLADQQGGGSGRGGAVELRIAPGADSALASLLMRMVRTGELQLVQAS